MHKGMLKVYSNQFDVFTGSMILYFYDVELIIKIICINLLKVLNFICLYLNK